ncbi:MAG: OmpA family protein, partial [Cyclobacteriaceae bacterium]
TEFSLHYRLGRTLCSIIHTYRNLKTFIAILFFTTCLNCNIFCQSTSEKTFALNFDFDSYSLSQTDSTNLLNVLELCNSPKFNFLKVFAFCDTVGTVNYNVELSKKRAMAVWKFLDERTTFKEDNTYIEWLGESDEIYELHFEQAHYQQRCVDIIVQLNTQ